MILKKKSLAICKYGLDCQPYNTSNARVTWENCSLRYWLNNDFLSTAFTEDERSMIPSVIVDSDKNPSPDTHSGNNVTDQVFLLSSTEADKYFGTSEERRCVPTTFAIAQGVDKSENWGTGQWWLRSSDSESVYGSFVDIGGVIHSHNIRVDHDIFAVRPACWFILGASIIKSDNNHSMQ